MVSKLGVCVDDAWRYLGLKPPPSILIPHLLSIPLKPLRRAVGRGRIKLNSVEALAETLNKSGVKHVRFWLQWNFLQAKLPAPNEPPKYDWAALDRFVNALTRAGVELLPVVGCGYQRMLPEGADPTKRPVEYVRALAESVREVVRRYKNLIKVWQVENEPNWWFAHYAAGWRKGSIWLNPTKRFKRMLLSALKGAVEGEDGNAEVVVNLEVDRAVKDLDFYVKYCDIVGLDYYPNYSHAKPIDVSTLLPKAKKIVEETGKRVIVCETGYPSGPSALGYSRALQALYIRRLREALSGEGSIEAVFVWRLSDGGWRSFPEHENHFGLIGADGAPKPAWRAYLDWVKEAS